MMELNFQRLIVQRATLCQTITKRFSGGGGGKPTQRTFNWKEKKQLGLDKPQLKPLKVKPNLGYFEEIEPYFDASKGGTGKLIDITDLETFEETEIPEEESEPNKYTQVQVNRLFGSNKSFGALPGLVKPPFRGKRVDRKVFVGKRKNYLTGLWEDNQKPEKFYYNYKDKIKNKL